MARQQLRLIDTKPVWALDEHTKQVGRRGLAQARAALAAADQRRADREADRGRGRTDRAGRPAA